MVQYAYRPCSRSLDGHDRELSYDRAARRLGERVMSGWDARHQYVEDRDGTHSSVSVLLCPDGHVWAIYVS